MGQAVPHSAPSLCPPGRSVALWGVTKKKPLALARQAHGMKDAQGLQQPYWISALAALRNSDLLATGVWQLLWNRGLGSVCVETSCSRVQLGCMTVSSLCPRLSQHQCEALEVQ